MTLLSNLRKHFGAPVLLLGAGLALAACEKEYKRPYEAQDSGDFAVLTARPVGLLTKYAPGETVPLVVGYNAEDEPRQISIYHAIGRLDSGVVSTTPVNGGVFNPAAGLTEQVVNYVVPTNTANQPTIPNQTRIRVDVTTTYASGATRLRRFVYNLSRPTTMRAGVAPAFRNNLGGTAQTEGDIIGYNVIINEGGIGVLPTPPATNPAPLFKNVDSLTTFYRIGNGPEVRAGVVRNPTNGIADNRTVDVTVPRGSQGQAVTFLFRAYAALSPTVTVTAAPVNIVAPSPLARLREGRIAFNPFNNALTADSTAFNLRLGTNVNALPATLDKDITLAGLSASLPTLAGVNPPSPGASAPPPPPTTLYRLPQAQSTQLFFDNTTANTAGRLIYENRASITNNVGAVAVGDVFIVRVRNAEPMLLRVVGVRPSTNGSTARIVFNYRSVN